VAEFATPTERRRVRRPKDVSNWRAFSPILGKRGQGRVSFPAFAHPSFGGTPSARFLLSLRRSRAKRVMRQTVAEPRAIAALFCLSIRPAPHRQAIAVHCGGLQEKVRTMCRPLQACPQASPAKSSNVGFFACDSAGKVRRRSSSCMASCSSRSRARIRMISRVLKTVAEWRNCYSIPKWTTNFIGRCPR
jgi:hypothetical protein